MSKFRPIRSEENNLRTISEGTHAKENIWYLLSQSDITEACLNKSQEIKRVLSISRFAATVIAKQQSKHLVVNLLIL